MMSRIRTKGFTLVELMVVVAIIAVLMGILMPVVSKARRAARTAVCTSNLRQIDSSIRVWMLNYNKMRVPGAGWPSAVQKVINEGRVTVNDRNGADQIMTCPEMDPTYSVSTTTTVVPVGTDPPELLVEFEKNNGGHPVTWTQIDVNHWTAYESYQKNKPNYALFDFTRVGSTNSWNAVPKHIDPKAGGVGPPLSLYSVYDNKLYPNVLLNQTYLITGSPITPITSTTVTTNVATSYGINTAMANLMAPKNGRMLVMDYNKSTVDYTADDPTVFLIGRHNRNMHNALMTDGSVQLVSTKNLSFSATLNLYQNQ